MREIGKALALVTQIGVSMIVPIFLCLIFVFYSLYRNVGIFIFVKIFSQNVHTSEAGTYSQYYKHNH